MVTRSVAVNLAGSSAPEDMLSDRGRGNISEPNENFSSFLEVY